MLPLLLHSDNQKFVHAILLKTHFLRSPCVAVKPRHKISFCFINSICFLRYGTHASISSAVGVRLPGGRLLKH